jgi:hypothetical protein
MVGDLKFELSRLILDALRDAKTEGKLSVAIKLAADQRWPGETHTPIDPRTLRRLASAKTSSDVKLTFIQLRLLEAYFAPRGRSLAVLPLLGSDSVLLKIGQTPGKSMMFLLGAVQRREQKRIDLSRWDFQSATALVNDISAVAPGARYTMKEVIYEENLTAEEFDQRSWFSTIEDDTPIISIGSSRVNHATEYILAEMFPVRAPGGRVDHDSLPFVFTSGDTPAKSKSVFWLDREKFTALATRRGTKIDDKIWQALKAPGSQTRVLLAGAKAFVSSPEGGVSSGRGRKRTEYKTYGVIAVQRRASNRGIWVVVCGLSGPATFGSACEIAKVAGLLPDARSDGHSEPMWVVVESKVREAGDLADPRQVVSHRVIHRPPTGGQNRFEAEVS